MSTAVIPEPTAQLQRQLDEIRRTQPRGRKLPDSVWQAAVELAREHGVYSVAHPLRLDYTGLKKRLGGVSHRRRKARKPAFVELMAPPSAMLGECLIEFESLRLTQTRAAHILRIDQPKISRLLRGQLSGFSTERLIHFLTLLGRDVEITVKPAPRSRRQGHLRVVATA